MDPGDHSTHHVILRCLIQLQLFKALNWQISHHFLRLITSTSSSSSECELEARPQVMLGSKGWKSFTHTYTHMHGHSQGWKTLTWGQDLPHSWVDETHLNPYIPHTANKMLCAREDDCIAQTRRITGPTFLGSLTPASEPEAHPVGAVPLPPPRHTTWELSTCHLIRRIKLVCTCAWMNEFSPQTLQVGARVTSKAWCCIIQPWMKAGRINIPRQWDPPKLPAVLITT